MYTVIFSSQHCGELNLFTTQRECRMYDISWNHCATALFRPRGFPLEDLMNKVPHFFVRSSARPLIQQSLANVDPDVDAIYRLTQPLGITFDPQAFDVVLPSGSFCPFNR